MSDPHEMQHLKNQYCSNCKRKKLEDRVYGKLANVFADLDARGLQSSSMFKTLTTGDYVTAERKHGQPFRFRSYAKLLYSANRIPSSRDRSHAFYRRWLIIPFTRTFDGVAGNPPPDKGLREKLQGELPGILNRALQGLQRLNRNEAFTQPKSVIEAKKAYICSNDNLRVFAEECLLANPIGTITKKEFYAVYEQWCESYGDRPVRPKLLKDALKQIFPMLDEWRETKTSPRCWLGFEWSDDAASYKPASFSVGGQPL
jgi:putative DNA primase/helicase